MASLRQGVASAVDADVRLALQKMSTGFVHQALNDAKDPASAASAAHDAMSLQDALYGVPTIGAELPRAAKRSAPMPTTAPGEAPASAAPKAPAPPERTPQKRAQTSRRTPPTSSASSSNPRQPTPKAPAIPAHSVQVRRPRTVAASPALRSGPSSPASPAPVTARPKPAPRVRDEELLPNTEGLPLILRRHPSLVLKEARGKSASAREQMITTTRAALSALHRGAYPTKVARPAGDRAHAIIKGIERMQLTSPALKKSTSTKGKKAKRKKLKGGVTMSGASLRPEIRAQLERSQRDAAATARSRDIDAATQLPLSPRRPIYRGYGIPVSGGLPSLGRRG